MVYGIDILKVTALHYKMGPAMSSPLEPMMQLESATEWTHAKNSFFESQWFFHS